MILLTLSLVGCVVKLTHRTLGAKAKSLARKSLSRAKVWAKPRIPEDGIIMYILDFFDRQLANPMEGIKEQLKTLQEGQVAAQQRAVGVQFTPDSDDYYFIHPKHSNRVFDCNGDGDGAEIQLWDKDSGKDNKKFKFIPVGDGFFKIQPKHSHCVLDHDGDEDGAKLQLWSASDSQGTATNQQFKIEPVDDDGTWYFISSRRAGLRCLDCHGDSDGAKVQLWSSSDNSQGHHNRQFKFERVEPGTGSGSA